MQNNIFKLKVLADYTANDSWIYFLKKGILKSQLQQMFYMNDTKVSPLRIQFQNIYTKESNNLQVAVNKSWYQSTNIFHMRTSLQVQMRFRSSHPEVFLEKDVLKTWSKFTGEHPCRSVTHTGMSVLL